MTFRRSLLVERLSICPFGHPVLTAESDQRNVKKRALGIGAVNDGDAVSAPAVADEPAIQGR